MGRLLPIIAVSMIVKGKLANETVNYDTETKAYQFEPDVKLSKRAVQVKEQVELVFLKKESGSKNQCDKYQIQLKKEEQPPRRVLRRSFLKICSVNLLHIFQTPCPTSISGWLLLKKVFAAAKISTSVINLLKGGNS